MPDIIESNDYESPAMFWMYREIKRLNMTLVELGIAEEDTRREVCHSFFFGTQGGLTTPVAGMDGKRFTPLLTLGYLRCAHIPGMPRPDSRTNWPPSSVCSTVSWALMKEGCRD